MKIETIILVKILKTIPFDLVERYYLKVKRKLDDEKQRIERERDENLKKAARDDITKFIKDKGLELSLGKQAQYAPDVPVSYPKLKDPYDMQDSWQIFEDEYFDEQFCKQWLWVSDGKELEQVYYHKDGLKPIMMKCGNVSKYWYFPSKCIDGFIPELPK